MLLPPSTSTIEKWFSNLSIFCPLCNHIGCKLVHRRLSCFQTGWNSNSTFHNARPTLSPLRHCINYCIFVLCSVLGASKYCYSGLRKSYSLQPPGLPDLFHDEQPPAAPGGKVSADLGTITGVGLGNLPGS